MSEKRMRDDGDGGDRKRHKKGFQVGPANLPDGTHRRKVQKIKADLIGKAKIWKDYEKLKKRGEVPETDESIPIPASMAAELEQQEKDEPTVAPHPDRQILMDKEEDPEEDQPRQPKRKPRERRKKEEPFRKVHEQALQRKAEAEERRKAREEAQRQREQKIVEREKFRKAMAKARTGGKNGQRKLGRESQPLLEKVKRMMSE